MSDLATLETEIKSNLAEENAAIDAVIEQIITIAEKRVQIGRKLQEHKEQYTGNWADACTKLFGISHKHAYKYIKIAANSERYITACAAAERLIGFDAFLKPEPKERDNSEPPRQTQKEREEFIRSAKERARQYDEQQKAAFEEKIKVEAEERKAKREEEREQRQESLEDLIASLREKGTLSIEYLATLPKPVSFEEKVTRFGQLIIAFEKVELFNYLLKVAKQQTHSDKANGDTAFFKHISTICTETNNA